MLQHWLFRISTLLVWLLGEVLDDMETELGIPSVPGLPPEERSCLQREVLASRQGNRDLRTTLQQREQEIHRSKVMLSSLQEERDRLKNKVCE